jgi:hypothetical protein
MDQQSFRWPVRPDLYGRMADFLGRSNFLSNGQELLAQANQFGIIILRGATGSP